MRLKLLLVPVLALAGVLGVSAIAQAAPAPPPVSYTVNVGGGGSGIAANDFFPLSITIHKGDSIHFVNPYEEIHTVTHLGPTDAVPDLLIPSPSGPGLIFNPLAVTPTHSGLGSSQFDSNKYYTSGILGKGQSADVDFNVTSDADNPPGAGENEARFKFICLVHPFMQIDVKVTSAPVDVPVQAVIDKSAIAARDALITAGTAIANSVQLTKATSASGAATFNLLAGSGGAKADVMQFLPTGPTNINVGDTVHWTNPVFTPHTVTFLSGAAEPDLAVPQGATLAINPAAALPAGGATYDGTGIANSGLMDVTGQVPGGSSYSLTFTKAGTYTYLCLIHDDQGMKGTIVVGSGATAPAAPAGGTPAGTGGSRTGISAPNTGFGATPAAGNGGWTLSLLILGIAGAALVLAGVRPLATKRTS